MSLIIIVEDWRLRLREMADDTVEKDCECGLLEGLWTVSQFTGTM